MNRNLKLVVNNTFKKDKNYFFEKDELKSILNLYAKMVSNGTWKDYSLYTGNKEISFNIYKRASEKPILRILKNLKLFRSLDGQTPMKTIALLCFWRGAIQYHNHSLQLSLLV